MSNQKRPYKKADLNAPRIKHKIKGLVTVDFYAVLTKKHPHLKAIPYMKIKNILNVFHKECQEAIISNRDGIELPEGMGFMSIASCPAPDRSVNVVLSKQLGYEVGYRNLKTDGYMAKIMYSNIESKYKFANRKIWGFMAIREFKRNVAHTYPDNWTIYRQMYKGEKIREQYRKAKAAEARAKKRDIVESYNEFNLD